MRSTLRERFAENLTEIGRAVERMDGDSHTQGALAEMLPLIAKQISSINFGDDARSVKGVQLLGLGPIPHDSFQAGEVTCTRSAYVGADGKLYIEGPRKSLGRTVIDIHPYAVEDAMGWRGVSASQLADMVAACFI